MRSRGLTPNQAKKKYNITRDRDNGKPKNSHTTSLPRTSNSEPASDAEDALDDGDDFEGSDGEEPSDVLESEADELVKPPRTPRAMLAAVANLLFACEERSGEIDAACGDILDEISESVARIRAEVTSCETNS